MIQTNKKKIILVLENRDDVRKPIVMALQSCGFQVFSAKDITEARRLAALARYTFDLLILDMHLEESDLSGAELGLEIRERQKAWPPECIIHSGYDHVAYYQLAIRLGAAAYLRKASHSLQSVVNHVRALLLRRALSAENPRITEMINDIAEKSRDHVDAIARFGREIVLPELNLAIGPHYLLMLTARDGTQCLGSTMDLPKGVLRELDKVQQITYGQASLSNPMMVPAASLGIDAGKEGAEDVVGELGQCVGISVVPLSWKKDLRMSLGIVQEHHSNETQPRDAGELARIIGEYVRPSIVDHLFTITEIWTDLNSRREELLSATSRFCLYVGQEQIGMLNEVVGDGMRPLSSLDPSDLLKLRTLGEELIGAGELLARLESKVKCDFPAAYIQEISMADLIRSLWAEIGQDNDLAQASPLQIEGDCVVRGAQPGLQIAMLQILRWFAQRLVECIVDESPAVIARCYTDKGLAKVILDDRSLRLASNLREKLFFPFSGSYSIQADRPDEVGHLLGLYVSKMLVELENGGTLEDCSDKMEGKYGHRLVITLPGL